MFVGKKERAADSMVDGLVVGPFLSPLEVFLGETTYNLEWGVFAKVGAVPVVADCNRFRSRCIPLSQRSWSVTLRR